MNFKDNKFGYTLAEIMLVILVLSIIFAAFAPLITKRRTVANSSLYNIWNWANGNSETNGPKNAFYYTGNTAHDAVAFIGVSPESGTEVTSEIFSPNKISSKLTIRSLASVGENEIQRQIQFRYGQDGLKANGQPNSEFASSMLLDTRNILLGSKFSSLNYTDTVAQKPRNNVAIGYGALERIKNDTSASPSPMKNNVAIGYNSIGNATKAQDVVAIGFNAGAGDDLKSNSTYVGSGAGASSSAKAGTYIGYMTGNKTSGDNNTFIGAYVGQNATEANHNVGIGYNALGSLTKGTYNTAIGAHALEKLTTGSYNVAIGYNACSNVTTGSYKTCIGYNSGPQSGSTSETFFEKTQGKGAIADEAQRTYIGSKPYNYGGDAVLEIHNVKSSNSTLDNDPMVKSNVTTVINGNLVVQGKLFVSDGDKIYNPHYVSATNSNVVGLGISRNDYNNINKTCGSPEEPFEAFINNNYNSPCPQLSDRRLKNIGSLNTSGLDKISQLKVFNYNFKNDKNKTPQVSVIAQELQKVFPNSVFKGSDGYLKITWNEMFFAAVNAIKELDKKIAILVKRATNLEPQITKLEKQNEELKLQVAELTNRIERLKKK